MQRNLELALEFLRDVRSGRVTGRAAHERLESVERLIGQCLNEYDDTIDPTPLDYPRKAIDEVLALGLG